MEKKLNIKNLPRPLKEFEKHRVVCDECETYHHLLNNGWDSIVCTECDSIIPNPDLGIFERRHLGGES